MREEMLSLPSPLSVQFFVLSRPFSEVTPRHTFFYSCEICNRHLPVRPIQLVLSPAGWELLHVNLAVKFQAQKPTVSAWNQLKSTQDTSITNLKSPISFSRAVHKCIQSTKDGQGASWRRTTPEQSQTEIELHLACSVRSFLAVVKQTGRSWPHL